VGDHQYASAVRHQDHLTIDLVQFALDRLDPGCAAQAVDLQWRHAAHLGQAACEQVLPVFGNMVAQAGDDQHGGSGLQFFHGEPRVRCSS